MVRGRPLGSNIRQHMVELLHFMGSAYGYDIYKAYKDLFPSVTLRVIYYHLRKGTSLGEFKIDVVKKEEGKYSWGTHAEKIYYSLGPEAKPAVDEKVREYFEKRKK
jgi:hypothetical protein